MTRQAAIDKAVAWLKYGRKLLVDMEAALALPAESVEAEKVNELHRRCQRAEAALPDYKKLKALPPDGDGIRFVRGNMGRALLTGLCEKQQTRIAELEAQVQDKRLHVEQLRGESFTRGERIRELEAEVAADTARIRELMARVMALEAALRSAPEPKPNASHPYSSDPTKAFADPEYFAWWQNVRAAALGEDGG